MLCKNWLINLFGFIINNKQIIAFQFFGLITNILIRTIQRNKNLNKLKIINMSEQIFEIKFCSIINNADLKTLIYIIILLDNISIIISIKDLNLLICAFKKV